MDHHGREEKEKVRQWPSRPTVTGVIGCPYDDHGRDQASGGMIPSVTGVNKTQGARHPVMHGRDRSPGCEFSTFAFPNNNPCNVFDIYDVYSLF